MLRPGTLRNGGGRLSNPYLPPETPEEDFDELLEDESAAVRHGYESPLVARLRNGRLTVEMLATEIPRIRDGEEAARLLEIPSGRRSDDRVNELLVRKREGERAKERVFATALPLIRAVAHKEWRRRQQWGSAVRLEDLLQEATLGFLKGLAAYKPEAVRKSATNYLGQWMLVEMRRSSEVMDHDLQVGHDVGERFRKVRAIRSRLINELGREPTDDEIAAASKDATYASKQNMLGKAPTDNLAEVTHAKGLTAAQVAEERKARNRVGHVSRFAPMEDGVSSSSVDPERLTAKDGGHTKPMDPADLIADDTQRTIIAALVEQVMVRINMPAEQSDIIARRFGLPPHDEEESVRSISRSTGVHRERITRVLNAFTAEMTRKGGYFHEAVASLSEDDLHAIGLGWLIASLGPWQAAKQSSPRNLKVLTEVRGRNQHALPEPQTDSHGIIASFRCDYHDRVFSGLYASRRSVPRARACPACNNPATLIGTRDA